MRCVVKVQSIFLTLKHNKFIRSQEHTCSSGKAKRVMRYDVNQIISLEANSEGKPILHTTGTKKHDFGLIRYLLGVGFDPSRVTAT